MKNRKILIMIISVLSILIAAYFALKANEWTGHEAGFVAINLEADKKSDHPEPELIFKVPKKFRPEVHGDMFSVMFRYPDMSPVKPGSVIKDGIIDVRVFYSSDGKMRVDYALERTQERNGPIKGVPWWVANENDMDIYEYDFGGKTVAIGRKYIFRDNSGNQVVVNAGSPTLAVYRVYRRFSEHVELDYLFSKEIPPEEFRNIDRSTLNFVKTLLDTSTVEGEK